MINETLETSTKAFKTPSFTDGSFFPKADEKFGIDSYWDSSKRPGKWGLPSMDEFVNKMLPIQLETLQNTRNVTAKSMDMDPGMYGDYAKDLPVATSFEDLQRQFSAINGYADRNELQKEFLKEKVGARYMMKFAGDMGYGPQMYDNLHEEKSVGDILAHRDVDSSYGKMGYLPKSYKNPYTEKLEVHDIPAWANQGESGIPEFVDLYDWQRTYENASPGEYDKYRSQYIAENGDPEDILKQQGRAMVDQAALEKVRREMMEKRLSDIPEAKEDEVEEIRSGPHLPPLPPSVHGKIRSKVKGRKQWFKAMMREKVADRDEWLRDQQPHAQLLDDDDEGITQRFTDTGEIITAQSVAERFKDPYFDPTTLGEKSYGQFLINYIQNKYSWQKSPVLDEDVLPSSFISTKYTQNLYKPIADVIDKMDERIHATRFHDLVFAGDTEQYLERYHPDINKSTDMLARDHAGTTELFDDWSTPRVFNENSVEFHHQIHSQVEGSRRETIATAGEIGQTVTDK